MLIVKVKHLTTCRVNYSISQSREQELRVVIKTETAAL